MFCGVDNIFAYTFIIKLKFYNPLCVEFVHAYFIKDILWFPSDKQDLLIYRKLVTQIIFNRRISI